MPQKSHKKIKKEQKTKVKVKSSKTELPKGQNVTDTSFKVRKIQLKEQFPGHDDSESTPGRKLNIKELISRLRHHNSKMRSSALSGLRDVVLSREEEVLKSFFVTILEATAQLAMDDDSAVRQAAISLLGSILSKVKEEKLVPLLEPLMRYLACCMSHLNADIRTDSLHLIDVLLTLPPHCSSELFMATIFPRFLDMISSSSEKGDSKRSLLVDLHVNTTSTLWRVGVLIRLHRLLEAISQSCSLKVTGENKVNNMKSITWSEEEYIHLPLYHSTSKSYSKFEPLELNRLAFQKRTELGSNNVQYYANVLMPLLMDSFTEVTTEFRHSHEVFLISLEAAALLSCITGIILSLWDLLSSFNSSGDQLTWFRRTYAEPIRKKFILDKFPYNIGISNRTEESQEIFELFEKSKRSMDQTCVEQNINLCHIAALMMPQAYPESMAKYIFGYLDEVENMSRLKANTLISCLRALIDAKKNRRGPLKGVDFPQLIHKVVALYFKFKKTQDGETTLSLLHLLSSVVMDPQFKKLHRDKQLTRWLGSLPELLCQEIICFKTVKIVVKIATHAPPGFLFGLETWIEAILDNLPQFSLSDNEDNLDEAKGLIAGLVYYIKNWDEDLVKSIARGVSTNYFGTSLSSYIKDLVEDRIGSSLPESEKVPTV
ncbi:testis-expressed protein 10 homolog [Bemisia tabaci]|uniref:testis-expressed protein 10 homolog n=1 Tax=Bemisia tabaci TaxID=7038 RepID=UPI003B28703E